MSDTSFKDDFDSSGFVPDPINTLKVLNIQHYNGYAGNAPAIKGGGYGIPLAQVVDPSVLFKIGKEATHHPQQGNPYQIYAAPSIDVAIIGYTPVYNMVNESLFVEGGRRGVPIGKNWLKIRTADDKPVCYTQQTVYLVFRNDESKTPYRLSFNRMTTDRSNAMLGQLYRVCETYARLRTKQGKPTEVPGPFLFWVTIGVGDSVQVGTGDKKGFISPPAILWKEDKIPATWDEILQYRVSQEEFVFLRDERAIPLRTHINGDQSPMIPQQLSQAFLAAANLPDNFTFDNQGKTLPSGSQATGQLAGPSATDIMLDAFGKLPEVTPVAWKKSHGGSDAKLRELFGLGNIKLEDALSTSGVNSVDDIEMTLQDWAAVALAA